MLGLMPELSGKPYHRSPEVSQAIISVVFRQHGDWNPSTEGIYVAIWNAYPESSLSYAGKSEPEDLLVRSLSAV